jgi:hypothetical protein
MAARKKAAKPSKAATKPTKVPTAGQLAGTLELTLTEELTAKEVASLRKALPGYASLLDNAADALASGTLVLKDVTPETLRAAEKHRADLLAREQVLYRVWRSAYHQRLQADDVAMGLLQKIARRVDAMAEDEPELRDEWKFLSDFLGMFRRKGPVAAPAVDNLTPPAK